MSAGGPRLVALVPTWRAEGILERTLASLAAQTWPNLEVLVSDDASPDGTAAVAERFAARDPRFRVVRQKRNLGWVGNVNALLAAAHGDLFAFAFQDDLPEPDYFSRCVAALERDPEAILAYSDVVLVQADGRTETKRYLQLDGVRSRRERGCAVASQIGSWWIPNRGVFRARAAQEIGGLHRHRAGEFSADWPWLLHMSLLGPFVRVPGPLVTKIYQRDSLSRSWRFGTREWLAVAAVASRAVRRAGVPIGESLAIHAELARFLADRSVRSARRWIRRPGERPGAR